MRAAVCEEDMGISFHYTSSQKANLLLPILLAHATYGLEIILPEILLVLELVWVEHDHWALKIYPAHERSTQPISHPLLEGWRKSPDRVNTVRQVLIFFLPQPAPGIERR